MTSSLDLHSLSRISSCRLYMTVMVCAALLCAYQARADTNSNCLTPPESDIVRLLNNWKAVLASGSVDQVSAFYADDAILSARQSTSPYKGKQAIRAYFADLLARHPQASIISRNVTTGCDSARVSGFILYRVTGARKGTRMLLGGQYMTEFTHQSGTWQIARQTLAVNPRSAGEPLTPEPGSASPSL
jgi:hypothetical protein